MAAKLGWRLLMASMIERSWSSLAESRRSTTTPFFDLPSRWPAICEASMVLAPDCFCDFSHA
jgi:hypothetical protein